ncbi:proline-rich protein 36 isoform X5 [Phlebotomus argentipes]|uniref:proline-rich protein 36 isoform X5 n=1 Tax=Phlebotomus argentipes TaxID=94469 RepID=UPI0028934438|nr:proline-rich protein 36 isoform X5 [Phlebotomus argentipes]
MATMVNMNNLLNGKDSRWLQLEVCREFQRNKCSRPDTECKFAHPPANVEVQNGRVTACYDSIKGRCNREKPPCKYFHPPQHLKDQLLINGRNHLALKNALMQQMGIAPGQPVIPGQVQTVDVQNGNTSVSPIGFSLQFGSQPIMATNPYLTGMPTSTYSHYFAPGHLMPTILGPDPSTVSPLGPVVPQAVPVAQQKIPRSDRLEMDVKSVGSFYYDNFAFPGMVPYKRPAADKSGIPVYQPGATTYQQLMQLQQPFVPVSSNPIAIVNSNTNSSHFNPTTNSSNSVDVNCNSTSSVSCSSSSSQNSVASVEITAVTSASEVAVNETETRPVSTQSIVAIPQTITATPVPYAIPANAAPPLYPDPAAIAKEVAQKNYANALKMAAASHALKPPLAALNYTGVALNKSGAGILPPQPVSPAAAAAAAAAAAQAAKNTALARLKTPFSVAPPPAGHSSAVSMFPTLARPPPPVIVQAPHLLRPGLTPQHPYMAAAAQPNPQFLQQGLVYPGFPASSYLASPVPGAVPPNLHGAGLGGFQALQAVQQAAAAQQTSTPGSAVVLNPYKKMKTS